MDELELYIQLQTSWKPVTQALYRNWATHFHGFLSQRKLTWDRCQAADLEAFRQSLLWKTGRGGKLLSANTIDQGLRFVRAFYAWAEAEGRVEVNPARHWILPRPPQPARETLLWEELLQLLNKPDLATAPGQRDHLILHLLYSGQLSARECIELRLDQVHDDFLECGDRSVDLDNGLGPALRLYLEDGRPQLEREKKAALLLTDRGQPFVSETGFRLRLRRYTKCSINSLHASFRAHQARAQQRITF